MLAVASIGWAPRARRREIMLSRCQLDRAADFWLRGRREHFRFLVSRLVSFESGTFGTNRFNSAPDPAEWPFTRSLRHQLGRPASQDCAVERPTLTPASPAVVMIRHPHLISTAKFNGRAIASRHAIALDPRYPGFRQIGGMGKGSAPRYCDATIPTTDRRLICRRVTGAGPSRYPWQCHDSAPRLPPASGSARGSSSGWP